MAAKIEYRDIPQEKIAEIEDEYAKPITPQLMKEYLFKMYEVTEEQATELVKKYAELITDAMNVGSFIYYTANEIMDRELMEGK